jgi:hypothetical protein
MGSDPNMQQNIVVGMTLRITKLKNRQAALEETK